MQRKINTNCQGKDFSKQEELFAWLKGTIINGKDPEFIRLDKCGAIIYFNQYGNRSSEYGWEIDHIIPVSKCGTDDLINLQPLHWKNNNSKSDKPDNPSQYCIIREKN